MWVVIAIIGFVFRFGGFDARLQGFCIAPEDIQICTRDDGTEWLLVGTGTFHPAPGSHKSKVNCKEKPRWRFAEFCTRDDGTERLLLIRCFVGLLQYCVSTVISWCHARHHTSKALAPLLRIEC